MYLQQICSEQLRCSSPSGQQYYSSLRLWTSACTVLCLERTLHSSWELSCLHLRPAFWEERAVWEPWWALELSCKEFQQRLSSLPHPKAPAPACLAVVLTPIFFSLMEKNQPLLLQGRIAAHGQESQSTISMFWEQLNINSVPGCCTEFPNNCHRHCAVGPLCCTGKYIALTDYG